MTGILKSLLEDTIEERMPLLETMKKQKRIVEMLEGVGVAHPLKALYQIKRALTKGEKITLTQIRRWGK